MVTTNRTRNAEALQAQDKSLALSRTWKYSDSSIGSTVEMFVVVDRNDQHVHTALSGAEADSFCDAFNRRSKNNAVRIIRRVVRI